MPLFHIHGLIGATLSSLAAGASIVCTPGFDVTTFFEWMEAFHPTWYTAVPTMHQAILTRTEINRDIITRRPLRFIRSSSSALSPQVMAELERVFQAPVIESYGMTEASHQMASNPLPPRVRKAGSVGVAAGPEMAIMDDAGNLLPPGQKGELVIRGASVTQGYEGNPTANKSAFTNGWFRTGDQGFSDAEGYFFVTGRLKEIINRGGEKISPREVDEVLMDHPAIAQVATFAAPDVLLGEEIAAAVVLREHTSATEREIQEFAATRLADFKVPRRVIILKEIPKGPTGKLQRIGLAEKLGFTTPDPARPKQERAFVAPRDALELQLTKIWEKVLAIKPIGIKDNFFDLGGYSLLAVRLFEEIDRATGKNLPLATLFQALTVEQLADTLRQEGWSAFWSPLVAIQSNGSNPPFFFIHAVSGNVLHYRYLSRYLGPDQPFYGLQAQGLDGKQAPHTRIEDMAALYIKEIRTLQPEGPYLLGGGSSGGVVAFEMAQQLHAQGQKVALLALFDTYFLGDLSYPPSPALCRSTTYNFVQKVDRHLGNLLLLRPQDRLSYILGIVGRIKTRIGRKVQGITYKGYPQSEGSISHTLQEVLKANRQALSNYIPQVYPGRITLFLSREAPERSCYDRRLGWNEMATGGLEVCVVPGNHETLFGEPHVRILAEKLRVCLQRVQVTLS
jgi:thioesterase domain-containing protein